VEGKTDNSNVNNLVRDGNDILFRFAFRAPEIKTQPSSLFSKSSPTLSSSFTFSGLELKTECPEIDIALTLYVKNSRKGKANKQRLLTLLSQKSADPDLFVMSDCALSTSSLYPPILTGSLGLLGVYKPSSLPSYTPILCAVDKGNIYVPSILLKTRLDDPSGLDKKDEKTDEDSNTNALVSTPVNSSKPTKDLNKNKSEKKNAKKDRDVKTPGNVENTNNLESCINPLEDPTLITYMVEGRILTAIPTYYIDNKKSERKKIYEEEMEKEKEKAIIKEREKENQRELELQKEKERDLTLSKEGKGKKDKIAKDVQISESSSSFLNDVGPSLSSLHEIVVGKLPVFI
jgi:hypothetical protein